MSVLRRRTFNTFVFEITPALEIVQVDKDVQPGKAMKSYTLKHNCVMLDPRVKRKKYYKETGEHEYTILSFTMWVGYEAGPKQLYKAIQLAQHYSVPITEYRVESIPKHLRKVTELVNTHNSLLTDMEGTILERFATEHPPT